MSFVHNALRAYRDRHLNTGSSRPLVQVCTYVGFGMFFVECCHHYLHTREARSYTSLLEGKVEDAKADLSQHLKSIDVKASELTAASRTIQAGTFVSPCLSAEANMLSKAKLLCMLGRQICHFTAFGAKFCQDQSCDRVFRVEGSAAGNTAATRAPSRELGKKVHGRNCPG